MVDAQKRIRGPPFLPLFPLFLLFLLFSSLFFSFLFSMSVDDDDDGDDGTFAIGARTDTLCQPDRSGGSVTVTNWAFGHAIRSALVSASISLSLYLFISLYLSLPLSPLPLRLGSGRIGPSAVHPPVRPGRTAVASWRGLDVAFHRDGDGDVDGPFRRRHRRERFFQAHRQERMDSNADDHLLPWLDNPKRAKDEADLGCFFFFSSFFLHLTSALL